MQSIVTALIIMVFSALGGCVFHSGPQEKVQLTRLTGIGDLVGVYENRGDPSGYLSRFLFGYATPDDDVESAQIEHEKIAKIQILRIDKGIDVKAIAHDCILARRLLLEGDELTFKDGKVVIDQEAYLLTRGAGDVVLGPSTSKTVLGIDTEGNLIWRRQDYAAGLLFVIFPMALSDLSEIRFKRLGLEPEESYGQCDDQISIISL